MLGNVAFSTTYTREFSREQTNQKRMDEVSVCSQKVTEGLMRWDCAVYHPFE